MIIQQCSNCIERGKNAYCNNCIKSGDNYDVYKYVEDKNNRFSKGRMIGRIKAYTWHDAIDHIKDNFFQDRNENLNINCEKDFAYLEEKRITVINDKKEEKVSGYKIYLNKEGNESGDIKDENFWDLTAPASNDNTANLSDTSRKNSH
ncbi:MAG: hypothetical protein WA667_00450 [Candidatus Nitrosopolaris sp.]